MICGFSYDILLRCWTACPADRPTFEQVRSLLYAFLDDATSNYYLQEYGDKTIVEYKNAVVFSVRAV